MSSKSPKNTAASVRAKLLEIAKRRDVAFPHVLQQYVNERVLYRLSKTRHRDDFVLKGGTLFGLLFGQPHRPTKDLDLLGAVDNDHTTLRATFSTILAIKEDDGIVFDLGSLEVGTIKEEEQYEGVRINCMASIEQALISVQIDIGFGDAIINQNKIELQTLLSLPRPELFVYPLESVISEKFEAIVKLGLMNSRMKDFCDIHTLASNREFEGATLCEAIKQTFSRRQTPIPTSPPSALTKHFFEDKNKILQWKAFSRKAKLPSNLELREICKQIDRFIMPVSAQAAAAISFEGNWSNETGWAKKI